MQNESLTPETEELTKQMPYEDLKYPLLQRGIIIPLAMTDYIEGLIARDTLSDAEVNAIRQEMLQIFQDNGTEVPSDFHANFDTWFPRNKPNNTIVEQ
ncbi:MAG: hypothetical protein OXH00_02905 [Candidatus Poribacteria bacterium]|nr:hypothetical protein [Candidatus Poribacteria bacterium]